MPKPRLQFAATLALALLFAAGSLFAAPQRGRRGGRFPHRAQQQQGKQNPSNPGKGQNQGKADTTNPNGAGQPGAGNSLVSPDKKGDANGQGGNLRGMMGLPGPWIQHLQEMSPEEQERFLRNNARFQSLPPERQAQIRENLRRWNALSQDQRDAIKHRQEFLQNMSPSDREELRTQILPKWKALPPARRELLNQKLRALHDLSDTERDAKLKDPAFLQGLSPDEQDLLRRVSALRINPAASAPRNIVPPPVP